MKYEEQMIIKNDLRTSKIRLLASLEELCFITQKKGICHQSNEVSCKENYCNVFWEIRSLRDNLFDGPMILGGERPE